MRAICEREKLLHAFQTAAGVAPTRSPKPILQNLKLDVNAVRATLI
ncbi:MAG: DNA polymerase III subunit beta, partial [Thermoguttaceae bacterium]